MTDILHHVNFHLLLTQRRVNQHPTARGVILQHHVASRQHAPLRLIHRSERIVAAAQQ